MSRSKELFSVFRPPTLGVLPFDPQKENVQLLTQWLKFRNVCVNSLSKDILVSQFVQNMKETRDPEALMDFQDFDASKVSQQFLVNYLSWFGITVTDDKPKAWWEKQARKIVHKNITKRSSNIKNSFQVLIEQETKLIILQEKISLIQKYLDLLSRPNFDQIIHNAILYRQKNNQKILKLKKILNNSKPPAEIQVVNQKTSNLQPYIEIVKDNVGKIPQSFVQNIIATAKEEFVKEMTENANLRKNNYQRILQNTLVRTIKDLM